ESTSLPIVLYNVPSRAGVNMDAALIARLAGIRNIVGVKEASGNVAQMAEIIATVPSEFILVSGDDALTIGAMGVGGRGVLSVASNVAPSEMAQMVELVESNDWAAARKLYAWLLPLMQVNFVESNPIPVKAAMAAMGLLEPVWRLPLVPPSAANQMAIENVLRRCGLLIDRSVHAL